MPDPQPNPGRLKIAALMVLPGSIVTAIEASAFGPFAVQAHEPARPWALPEGDDRVDAILLADDGAGDARRVVAEAAADTAVLVVVVKLDPAKVLDWLARGAQDVLMRNELAAPTLPLRLRAAIERKRLEREARTAYATDVDTGLPHQQQLIEHMSQLIALREREPAPMALLALRIEGLATTEARLGREAARVLRRKVGVRLRAGVRASDVVASLGDDRFAVLLGSILAPADAARVGAKLMASLLQPFKLAGADVAVAGAIGIGQYPQDGSQPEALLRRALGLAVSAQAQGRAGLSNFAEAGAAGAANDE